MDRQQDPRRQSDETNGNEMDSEMEEHEADSKMNEVERVIEMEEDVADLAVVGGKIERRIEEVDKKAAEEEADSDHVPKNKPKADKDINQ
ncbi:unnamed protein product [Calypogeia fissa]